MDPLGAVCSMTNPSQSNQISMTNFAHSQQKKLRKICGKFKFFCGILNPAILVFRMYAIGIFTIFRIYTKAILNILHTCYKILFGQIILL